MTLFLSRNWSQFGNRFRPLQIQTNFTKGVPHAYTLIYSLKTIQHSR